VLRNFSRLEMVCWGCDRWPGLWPENGAGIAMEAKHPPSWIRGAKWMYIVMGLFWRS
jgi:hypothetical protein